MHTHLTHTHIGENHGNAGILKAACVRIVFLLCHYCLYKALQGVCLTSNCSLLDVFLRGRDSTMGSGHLSAALLLDCATPRSPLSVQNKQPHFTQFIVCFRLHGSLLSPGQFTSSSKYDHVEAKGPMIRFFSILC